MDPAPYTETVDSRKKAQANTCEPCCGRPSAKSLIMSKINRLEEEQAKLQALHDSLPTVMNHLADVALYDLVSKTF